jgi:opacity protein-like surface antigen
MRKTYLLSGVAAVALLLTNPIAAKAADIPIEPEPMLYDWSGIYIGGHAGAGALGTEGRYKNDTDSAMDLGALGGEIGGVFGGQVGFNWQAGGIVFGVEGDISVPNWDSWVIAAEDLPADFESGDTRIALDTDYLASVRARLGWADDNVLFYLTGGVAWFEGDLKLKGDDCDDDDVCSHSVSDTGGVAGVGLEWAAAENVSLRVEGLYYFFDDKIVCREDDDCEEKFLDDAETDDFFALDDAIVARVGLNLKFNWFN